MGPEIDEVNIPAVRRQVEYYFSDSNLPRDRFLLAKTEEDAEGYVPLSVLLTFNRIKKLGVTSEATLASAIQSSSSLNLDESQARIRRKTPLPAKSLFPTRAVFVKGWPPGGPEPDLDFLHDMFSPSGSVLSVQIRRWSSDDGKKHFKGSLFVEMDSPEAAERVVAEEYEIVVAFKDREETVSLLTELYQDWFDRKKRERDERREKTKLKYASKEADTRSGSEHCNEGNEVGVGSNKKKVFAAAEGKPGSKSEPGTDGDGNIKDEALPEKPREFTPGIILKFEGVGDNLSREDIRDALEEYGTISFVDFAIGQVDGSVRFSTAEEAQRACEQMTASGKLLAGKKPALRVLSGDEEKEHWDMVWSRMDAHRKRKRDDRSSRGRGWSHKRGRRGGGFSHRGRGGSKR